MQSIKLAGITAIACLCFTAATPAEEDIPLVPELIIEEQEEEETKPLIIIECGNPLDVDEDTSSNAEDNAVAAYSEEDLRYLSAIVWSEAESQCQSGQAAVAIVVVNRVGSEDFADTVKEVLYEKNQFTPARNGRLDKALKLYDSGEMPDTYINAAIYALEGNKEVSYYGVTTDLSDYLYFSRSLKYAKAEIQDHDFR